VSWNPFVKSNAKLVRITIPSTTMGAMSTHWSSTRTPSVHQPGQVLVTNCSLWREGRFATAGWQGM